MKLIMLGRDVSERSDRVIRRFAMLARDMARYSILFMSRTMVGHVPSNTRRRTVHCCWTCCLNKLQPHLRLAP